MADEAPEQKSVDKTTLREMSETLGVKVIRVTQDDKEYAGIDLSTLGNISEDAANKAADALASILGEEHKGALGKPPVVKNKDGEYRILLDADYVNANRDGLVELFNDKKDEIGTIIPKPDKNKLGGDLNAPVPDPSEPEERPGAKPSDPLPDSKLPGRLPNGDVPPPGDDYEPQATGTGEGEEPAPAAQSKKLGAKSAVGNMMNGGNMMGGLLGILLGALIGGPIGALIGLLLGFGAMAAFGGALGGGSDDKQTETVARGESVQVKSDDRTPKMQLNIDLGDNKGLLVKGQADENGNFVVTDSIRTEDNKPVKGSEKHFVPAKPVPMDASGAVNVDDVVKKVEEGEKPSTPKRGDKIATRTVSDNSPAPAPKEIGEVKVTDTRKIGEDGYQVDVAIDGKNYTLQGRGDNVSSDGKTVKMDLLIERRGGGVGEINAQPIKDGITLKTADIADGKTDAVTSDMNTKENKGKLAEPVSKLSNAKGPVASAPEKDGAHVDTGTEVSPAASGRGAAPKAASTGRK